MSQLRRSRPRAVLALVFVGLLGLACGVGVASAQSLDGITTTVLQATSTVKQVTSTIDDVASTVVSTVKDVTSTATKTTSTATSTVKDEADSVTQKTTSTTKQATSTTQQTSSATQPASSATQQASSATQPASSATQQASSGAMSSSSPAKQTSSGTQQASGATQPVSGGVTPQVFFGGSGASGSAGVSASESAGGAGASAERPRIRKLRASPVRFKNSGRAKKRKGTTLTFWLSGRARVNFVIRQEAPLCQVVGRFAVRGHRGTNRVRFSGRVSGKPLPPGTYTIRARAVRRSGRSALKTVTVVIVAPNSSVADAAAQPSECGAAPPAPAGQSLSFAMRSEASGNGPGNAGSALGASASSSDSSAPSLLPDGETATDAELLPGIPVPEDPQGLWRPALFLFAGLVLLLATLASAYTYVLHELTGSWNPLMNPFRRRD